MTEGVIPRIGLEVKMEYGEESPRVISIRPGVNITGQQNQATIDLLERYLERARSGEIQGIAVAGFAPDRITTEWDGSVIAESMITGATILLQRMVNAKLRADGME